jgi:uncharacterized membrane protein
MKKDTQLFLIMALTLAVLAVVAIFTLVPRLQTSIPAETDPASAIGYSTETVRAEIVAVLEEGETLLGDIEQEYQILEVETLEGPWKNVRFEIDYGLRQIRPPGLNLEVGDEILINVNQSPDRVLSAYFTDFVRNGPLMILFGTFVLLSIMISGWKGVRGLLGMAFSLAVILFYIIPNILAGRDPVLVSITGAFLLLAVTLYLVYGWTLKTHAAVLGTLTALILTGLLANYFVTLTRLTGFGSEEALFLVQQATNPINLRGLVLGGMLIGALGVLDDLVITQASVVFELFGADPHQSLRALFWRALRVGQDHVAATINTLVLAYAGAALPTLLLFSLSGEAYGQLLNLEFVAEEVVRTMVGSLGLIAAVPLTTGLASFLALNQARLGRLRPYLGPTGGGHTH